MPYGAAHALRPDDWILTAYRETGAALYRGYPLRTFMCQMLGNAEDPVKGRQMPVHHTVRKHNFVSISSPVGSQIPHAVGAAWAAKIAKKDDVAVGFFGEGATSTPTFHVSANFAAVFKIPVILICRNNGWAISVPRSVQTASPTFAQKAVAYGMPGVLVDGNDILAMIHVVQEAAARARRGEGATLIEARTYRRGAHSTSDNPDYYRDQNEPKEWESRDPLDRLRAYMQARGELPADHEAKIRADDHRGDPGRDRLRRARPRQAAARQPVRGRLRRGALAPARATGGAGSRAAQARPEEAAARLTARSGDQKLSRFGPTQALVTTWQTGQSALVTPTHAKPRGQPSSCVQSSRQWYGPPPRPAQISPAPHAALDVQVAGSQPVHASSSTHRLKNPIRPPRVVARFAAMPRDEAILRPGLRCRGARARRSACTRAGASTGSNAGNVSRFVVGVVHRA